MYDAIIFEYFSSFSTLHFCYRALLFEPVDNLSATHEITFYDVIFEYFLEKANKYEYYQKIFISQKNKYGKTYFVWICVDYPCRSITFNVADFVKRKSCDAVFVGTVYNNVRNLRNRTYDYKCRCVFQLVRTSGDTVFNSARRFGIYDDTLYCVYSFKPTNRT